MIEISDTPEALFDVAEEHGWGDGLPLVAPTHDRVECMLGHFAARRNETLGAVPPFWGDGTYEKVAINAVMAGCRPEYFPVVVSAVRAILQDQFNLYGIQATTSSATPMLVVNGPMVGELGINSGGNWSGPGWRANATIGRAVRLVMHNVGGGRPRALGSDSIPAFDFCTQGFPGKYTLCGGENEGDSPWKPLHVDRGFSPEQSTVTAIAANSLHDYRDTVSDTGHDLLWGIGRAIASWGTANLLYGGEPAFVLSPEFADTIAGDGYSKRDVQEFIFEHARLDMSSAPRSSQDLHRGRRPRWAQLARFPVFDRPEDLIVIVMGGPGIQGYYVSTFGGSRSATELIERP